MKAKRWAAQVESLLDHGQRQVRSLLAGHRTRFVTAEELRSADPQLISFMNIYTPEDLQRAHAVEEAHGDG